MAKYTLTQNAANVLDALNDLAAAFTEIGFDMSKVPASEYGDFVREHVGGAQPTLYTPSISRSGNNVYISNPSSNGSFVTGYAVYNGDDILRTTTSTTLDLLSLGAGEYQIAVAAAGQNFTDSDKSNVVKANVYRITKSLENLTANNSATLISNGLEYTVTLTPTSGYYLPEDVVVTMGGKATNFDYDSYSGVITIKSVTGDIDITAAAYSAPKLRRPVISRNGTILTVEPPRFAKTTKVFIDGVEEWSFTDNNTWAVEAVSGASYGFSMNSSGYYESQCKGVSNGYALCKVAFDLEEEKQVTINCINSGESNYDYGIISKVDSTLSTSNTDDGSTGSGNVLKNFKGLSSTSVQPVAVTVPAGQHFIYVKYRKDGGGDQGNDSLQFTVTW